ncbi:MAG TPA: glycosyltransferase family 4 protein [Blastocatellia bacterium]|nr:glycosyltransferase family 4 protein [Blastocatellia bacterium]
MTREKRRSKPIRALVVAAPPDWPGGQAVQAARLLEGLARESGVEAELLPIHPRLPGALQLLHEIKYARTVVYTVAYVALLLLRMPRFDVAHVFAASYFSFVLTPAPAVLIAKLYGKPVLLNYHSGEAEDHLRRWPRSTKLIFRLADRVVVPSRHLVGIFARFGIEAEAVINTAPLERFTFRERRPLRPTLLSNRGLESHYNVADTLRAFALVERRVHDARLIVAGAGGERSRLQALAAELGLKRVEFVGAAPPDRMPELYDRADIFVNSSLVDNMPLSLIEAFACGLAVVSSDAGGIPSLVTGGETGLLSPCGDYEALAANVIRLLEDQRLAADLIGRARVACRQYTWEAARGSWLKIYESIVGGVE